MSRQQPGVSMSQPQPLWTNNRNGQAGRGGGGGSGNDEGNYSRSYRPY